MLGAQNLFTTGSKTSGPALPCGPVTVHVSPLAGAKVAQPTSRDFANASSSARVVEAGTITVHPSQAQSHKPAAQSMSSSGTVFQDTGSVELAQTTLGSAVVTADTVVTQTASAGAGECCDGFCKCCASGCEFCGDVLSGLGRGLFCLLTCCCPSD